MLSVENYETLKRIRDEKDILVNPNGKIVSGTIGLERLEHLRSLGLINREGANVKLTDSDGAVSQVFAYLYAITPAGFDAIIQHEHGIKKEADDKAEQERENKLTHERWRKDARRSWIHLVINAIVAIVSAVLGIVLGAYLARYTEALDWLFIFFK